MGVVAYHLSEAARLKSLSVLGRKRGPRHPREAVWDREAGWRDAFPGGAT